MTGLLSAQQIVFSRPTSSSCIFWAKWQTQRQHPLLQSLWSWTAFRLLFAATLIRTCSLITSSVPNLWDALQVLHTQVIVRFKYPPTYCQCQMFHSHYCSKPAGRKAEPYSSISQSTRKHRIMYLVGMMTEIWPLITLKSKESSAGRCIVKGTNGNCLCGAPYIVPVLNKCKFDLPRSQSEEFESLDTLVKRQRGTHQLQTPHPLG